jgi:hypothetical protein
MPPSKLVFVTKACDADADSASLDRTAAVTFTLASALWPLPSETVLSCGGEPGVIRRKEIHLPYLS